MNKYKIKKKISNSKLYSMYHKFVSRPKRNLYAYLFRMKKNKIKYPLFYKESEVFNLLINNKNSFTRFGDGEISWIYGNSFEHFGQENSKELSGKLIETLNNKSENILIGIPNFFDSEEEYSKERKLNRDAHLFTSYSKWEELIDYDKKYADSLLTRAYNGRNSKNSLRIFNNWKSVWEGKDILLIEGEHTKFGIGNDLLKNANHVKRIIAPSENAFRYYNEILNEGLKYKNSTDIYLVALGPSATVLSYEFALNGVQAIDIGHLDIEYEWFKRKAEKKVAIRGKYVNEANGAPIEEFNKRELFEYYDQVVAEILMK